MKTLKNAFLIGSFLFSSLAMADFVKSEAIKGAASDVIIDNQFVDNVSWEEPTFSSRRVERDVAQFKEASTEAVTEWQGNLAILKEIPYSYAQLSRLTLQMRVLNELEAEEAQSQDKSL